MNKKLIIYPLIILMVFIISKLILNIFHLEYQSWIYYLLIIMLAFYGYDYKINNEYLVEDTLLQLRPSKELYHYKNFILKSTKAIPINKKGKIE